MKSELLALIHRVMPEKFAVPDHPDTIFLCACGERVGRRRKGKRYQVPRGFVCPRHGELRSLTPDDMDAEWVRLGKPDRFTIKLRPARRNPAD